MPRGKELARETQTPSGYMSLEVRDYSVRQLRMQEVSPGHLVDCPDAEAAHYRRAAESTELRRDLRYGQEPV